MLLVADSVLAAHILAAEEEERQRARADVTAGDRLIKDIEDALRTRAEGR